MTRARMRSHPTYRQQTGPGTTRPPYVHFIRPTPYLRSALKPAVPSFGATCKRGYLD